MARVGQAIRDQFVETGHSDRPDDIRRIAALGFQAVRYPVHWEVVAPEPGPERRWGWYDDRLALIRDAGIQVIAGLVHHGSGPIHTDLVSPSFVDGLARHAAETAARYPWITDYTPVNEPLTTARFSGLYGLWYPHGRDYDVFLRALLTQVLATRAAMREIRRVVPKARLIQTEDLGRVFGSSSLRHQIAHENERRWLSFDLLLGRVDRHHPFRPVFLAHGIAERDLDGLVDEPCPPDILGINHYLSSDRYLDTDVDRHAGVPVGGNGRERYVDVAAAMVPDVPAEDVGWLPRLGEVNARYGLPMALTEVHNGCTREEQLRWVEDAVDAARTVAAAGADVRAVTAWSVVGAVDWRSLLTRAEGAYESGLFDVGGGTPRPTALAEQWRRIAAGESAAGPVSGAGWWQRRRAVGAVTGRLAAPRALLVLGDTATARAILVAATERGLDTVVEAGRLPLPDLLAVVSEGTFWAVVDGLRPHRSARVAVAEVAHACRLPLLTFSDHRVFDGAAGRPYAEPDPLRPICRSGHRLAELERDILTRNDEALVIRSGHLFGPWPDVPLRLPASEEVTPTYLPDFADRALDLLLDGATGTWHVVGATAARRRDGAPLRRSRTLTSAKGGLLGTLDEALARCARARGG